MILGGHLEKKVSWIFTCFIQIVQRLLIEIKNETIKVLEDTWKKISNIRGGKVFLRITQNTGDKTEKNGKLDSAKNEFNMAKPP